MTQPRLVQPDSAPAPALGPVAGSERIQVLDVLRGVALLGILLTNIQHFAMLAGTVRNPTLMGDFTGLNFGVYFLTYTLILQKFMPLFSMLFGAGILLAADRREAAGLSVGSFHYRRMGILLLISLVHAYLIWYGDILFSYAVCGSIVFLFRERSPRFLITAGIGLLALFPLIRFLIVTVPGIVPHLDFFPGLSFEEIIAADVEAFRGGWLENFGMRVKYVLEDQLIGLPVHTVWRVSALMLIGMGLYRLGVITGKAKRNTYVILAVLGAGLALPVTVATFFHSHARGWTDPWARELSQQVIHFFGVVQSLGIMGIVMLLCRSGCRGWFAQRLAAVGRTALSNYLLQSVICTFIFYGFGLGLYASVERTGQVAIVFGIWIVQLTLSSLWLRRFRFGPAEWVWRSLAYGRRQPFRFSP